VMVTICTLVLTLCTLVHSLVAPPTAAIYHASSPSHDVKMMVRPSSRREALQGSAAAVLLGNLPLAAIAEEEFELVINQASLLSGLADSPVRSVIITGASSGVGLAGAKLLTAAGHRVTLACRTQAKADAAAEACNEFAASTSADGPTGLKNFYAQRRAGGSARGAECDLSSLKSVRSFAATAASQPLDTLVLNAGLSLNVGDKEEKRTEDGFELTVGTNHLGHFALAKLLLPTLEKGVKPRLLVTGSGVHDPASEGGKQGGPDKWASLGDMTGLAGGPKFTMVDGGAYDPDKSYKDSKLCNLMFTGEAARRYEGKVTVNAFSPGLIADPKGFFRNQTPLFAAAFNGITQKLGVGETNDFAGSALGYLAVDPAMEGRTGGWYDALPLGKHSLAKHEPSVEARDTAKQAKLWTLSEKLVA